MFRFALPRGATPDAGETRVCILVAVLSSARPGEVVDPVDCAWLEPSHGGHCVRSFPPHGPFVLRRRDRRQCTSIHWCYLHDGRAPRNVARSLCPDFTAGRPRVQSKTIYSLVSTLSSEPHSRLTLSRSCSILASVSSILVRMVGVRSLRASISSARRISEL